MVFFASGRSAVASPDVIGIDKVAHFSVFGLLGTLVARALPKRRWWWGAVLAATYGLADEFRQSFTPGRSVEVADWLADTVGASLAVALYARWSGYRALLEWKFVRPARESVANAALAASDGRA